MNPLQGDDHHRTRMWMKIRMGLVAAVFIGGFAAVVGRVYYLQTVESEALQQRSATQLDREVTRQARRGDIVDRNGVELAVSVEVPSIFARPKVIENPEREARRLLPHLDTSYETLVRRLSSSSNFVWLERLARPDSAEAIASLKIPGIGITHEYKRYYPHRERAGQILGFVNIDGVGLEGVESVLDKEMSGGTYQMRISRDAQGRAMLVSEAPRFRDFEGYTVRLTIDEKVQRVAEEALAAQVEKFSARGGLAVVLDVHSGDVLAMANTPSFDPNRVADHTSADWRLRNVTDTFEPGSVFKPFVLAAALQEEAVTLDTMFDCEGGRMKIGRYTIRDTKRCDVLSAAEIMQVSSNIGSYKIAQTIGREKYYEYIRAFGFGQRTGVGLRGEQPGLVWPPDRWAEISFANVAFGQGLTTTPLQLAVATAAIANGGLLMKPRLVDSIVDRDGNVVQSNAPTLVRRVISPEVARQTAWAMSLVTVEGGTGTRAALDEFTVAGKTGTAQKVNPETRRYDPNMWMAGFMGFVPAEKPEIAIVVIIDEPHKMHYGGVVAGPVFASIARETLALRGVMPLPEDERFDLGKRPEAKNGAAVAAAAPTPLLAPPAPANTLMLPAMRVLDGELDPELEEGEEGEREFADGPRVPDFRHMTLRQAMRRAQELGTSPQVEGWGRVIAQDPAPGTPLGGATVVSLVLSPATGQSLIADEPSTGTYQ